jgi:OTU domain-containing protein 5
LEPLTKEEEISEYRGKEAAFEQEMTEVGFRIEQVGTDGNCLFRAFSLQAYGTEDFHRLVRVMCMRYV